MKTTFSFSLFYTLVTIIIHFIKFCPDIIIHFIKFRPDIFLLIGFISVHYSHQGRSNKTTVKNREISFFIFILLVFFLNFETYFSVKGKSKWLSIKLSAYLFMTAKSNQNKIVNFLCPIKSEKLYTYKCSIPSEPTTTSCATSVTKANRIKCCPPRSSLLGS